MNIIKDKRAKYTDVFVFIIMAFAITIFFGVMYYGFSQFNDVLTSVQFDIGDTNFSTIVDQTWGQVFDAYDQLKTLAYVLIFGMMLTIFTSAYAVRKPPIFLVIWIITSLVAIIAAVYVSNAYQLLLLNADFGATLQSFAGSSYMILYLPGLSAVISLFAGLLSLIGLNRSKREEGFP